MNNREKFYRAIETSNDVAFNHPEMGNFYFDGISLTSTSKGITAYNINPKSYTDILGYMTVLISKGRHIHFNKEGDIVNLKCDVCKEDAIPTFSMYPLTDETYCWKCYSELIS